MKAPASRGKVNGASCGALTLFPSMSVYHSISLCISPSLSIPLSLSLFPLCLSFHPFFYFCFSFICILILWSSSHHPSFSLSFSSLSTHLSSVFLPVFLQQLSSPHPHMCVSLSLSLSLFLCLSLSHHQSTWRS